MDREAFPHIEPVDAQACRYNRPVVEPSLALGGGCAEAWLRSLLPAVWSSSARPAGWPFQMQPLDVALNDSQACTYQRPAAEPNLVSGTKVYGYCNKGQSPTSPCQDCDIGFPGSNPATNCAVAAVSCSPVFLARQSTPVFKMEIFATLLSLVIAMLPLQFGSTKKFPCDAFLEVVIARCQTPACLLMLSPAAHLLC